MFARLVFALALIAALSAAAREPDDRPNVVLILADDLGWADLGCQGGDFYRTPRIDQLAADGRRFTQAYAASPVCSPTRAALMTGRHPARLRLTDWLPGRPDRPDQRLLRPILSAGLPLAETTLAERLRAAGYATAHVGKWHLGGQGFEPTRQGFDLNVAGDAAGSPRSYFAPFAAGGQQMPGLEDAPAGQYLTDRLTDEAVNFIDAHAGGPFFLYLAHFAVHLPLAAKPQMIDHYPPWDGVPHGRRENPIYAAMVESLDESVGRVVDKLRELELDRRTIIVFTSDNGGLATREGPHTPATINSPLREGKGWLYEGGLRVPLVVAWPGHIEPGSDDTPVWSADLPPTALALCGQPVPNELDGLSLAGLLLDRQPLPSRPLYWHYPHYSNQGGRPGGAVREGDWKLIEFYETGRRELFDLAHDAGESRNLAESEPARAEALAAKLARWRETVGAQMPTPNPGYQPIGQNDNGVVVLPARRAEVHGVMLRYEPLPHKNTLGYWVRADDWAEWEFDVREPGDFRLTALIGCGTGSGGSEVGFGVAFGENDAEVLLKFTVPETGGFQQFVEREIGPVSFAEPGRYRLQMRANSKPGPAVMDVREVRLSPVKK
jgi:arylsulfatase A